PPDRFESLVELQNAHAELVKDVGTDVLAPGNSQKVAAFVRRALASGTVLDTKEARAIAQGLINFWTSRLSSAARAAERMEAGKGLAGGSEALESRTGMLAYAVPGQPMPEPSRADERATGQRGAGAPAWDVPQFEDTLLAEFDEAAVRSAGDAADRWLSSL